VAAGAGSALAVALLAVAIVSPRPAASAPSPTPAASVVAATSAPSREPGASREPGVAQRYRVKEGDTLRSIADQFGVTIRELRAINDLGTPPTIEPGQVIRIPRSD
jgi:LysM repeat protein